jgi:hypothetical protein
LNPLQYLVGFPITLETIRAQLLENLTDRVEIRKRLPS